MIETTEGRLSDPLDHTIAEAVAGSSEALGEATRECRPGLLRVANKRIAPRLRPKAAASDLVSEAIREAIRSFHRFQGSSGAAFRAWLYSILDHKINQFVKRFGTLMRDPKREVRFDHGTDATFRNDLVDKGRSPLSDYVLREQARDLADAIKRLPERDREVIRLKMELKTFEEVAVRMATTPDAARKRWSRAVELIRRQMPAEV